MRCPICKQDTLQALVTLPPRWYRLNQRRGGIILAGRTTPKTLWKAAWENEIPREGEEAGAPRKVRGPIICSACLTEFVYRVGKVPALCTLIQHNRRLERAKRQHELDVAALPPDSEEE